MSVQSGQSGLPEKPEETDLDKNPIKYAQGDGTFSTEAHDKPYMEMVLRQGKHSDLVKKILRQRIESRAKEFPRWPGEQTSGVRALWIESRFWYDRERLLPDYDEEWRNYRARYLHSLELDPREPVHVPEYEKQFLNPLRRFYMKGGDLLEYGLIRKFTSDRWKSAMYRVSITRGFMCYLGAIGIYYWAKYTHKTWEKSSGIECHVSAPIIYPDHPKYPFEDHRTEPHHHFDQEFTKRKVYQDLRDFEDNTVVL